MEICLLKFPCNQMKRIFKKILAEKKISSPFKFIKLLIIANQFFEE